MVNYYTCDRCNNRTDTIYRYKEELLCPLCCENIPEEEVFILD